MPHFLSNVESLILRKRVMGVLGKKRIPIFNISKLDIPITTTTTHFFPRSVLSKSGLLLITLKRINLRQTEWKTFSYATKSLQSYKKQKVEHFNEKLWFRLVVGSVSSPNNDIVHPWMGLQITTSLSTNYSTCIEAAPKPLEAHETLSTHFTGFSLGSSPTAEFVKTP